ncbi:hypothetical protein PV10_07050 [Exophiala mesophila]|uniref:Uncharacterized protein n=1 Tax=Exophiala mesophila TaxID=212818 RepID=A0A0D1WKZ7_EXOME|nr:uncharacterized protein PV10_07050 [Exophiala mesophila]KIV89665.1 hypothetical protein PV10_07050 [Exophiala mesophila]
MVIVTDFQTPTPTPAPAPVPTQDHTMDHESLPPNSFLTAPIISQPTNTTSPLSKRRRFTPNSLAPIIPITDNSDIEHHTFDSPLLLQLCGQAPDQAEIEAGLLQVGMRIRKSVAEGYKQQKKFTPRPFFNVSRLSPETQAALINGNKNSSDELMPYSAAQNLSTATFCGVSLAFMSHYSDDNTSQYNQQTLWNNYSTSHKRNYEADSDSDESQDWQPITPTLNPDAVMHMPVEYFNIGNDSMNDVDAMAQLANSSQQAAHGRRLAVPKSRNRNFQPMEHASSPFNPFSSFGVQTPEPSYATPTGHRRMVSCGMEAMDFADAPFLARREDVEMDCS